MLLGGKFYDLDGVVDYFSATQLGRWYSLDDDCFIVDGKLADGEPCGFISPRCARFQGQSFDQCTTQLQPSLTT